MPPLTTGPNGLPLVAVLNGPNLNMLGIREPALYGTATLDDLEQACAEAGERAGVAIDFRQTNAESELIGWVQACHRHAAGIVINAAGLTHTSVALMDALLAVGLPTIEVHLSNIFAREDFRHHSYISRAATGVVCGLGPRGYRLAIAALADLIEERR